MERLSTLDAEFLHFEDAVAPMHIAGVCVFANPPPAIGDLVAMIAGKLHLVPRYRQRVRPVPLELGRPVWVDDPHFDLDYHLRHTALPAPGDDAAFCRLMGRLMSQPLDRGRPLWETWLVEGLEDDRWALVFKIHHCMVDGIAGVELLEVLLDLDAEFTIPDPQPWTPSPQPSGPAMVLDAWAGLGADLVSWVRRAPGVVTHPREAVQGASDLLHGLSRLVGNLGITPPLSIEGSIGPHRSWAHSSIDLADVKLIRTALGGTVNDVVLAAVAGGYRALLSSHGDDADHAVVRSMVPVSVRHEDGHGIPDNRVSTLLCELPIDVEDPVERLRLVRERMTDLKGSHMAEAGEVMTTIGNLAPPMIVGAVTRAGLRSERLLPQRSINTVTTNVPGPQFPLYCLGHEMLEYHPFVGISHGLRVSTAILSYNGRAFFGVTGDRATVPDVDVLARASAQEIQVLRDIAATTTRPARRARAGSRRRAT